MYRTLSIAATCFAASLSVASALSFASAQSTVRVGTDVDAGTLDPRLTRDTTAYRTADLIYSGLVHLTPSLEPVPDLAESWENPDPQTWIFKLRPDLTFSDGSPLTADDVVFTLRASSIQDFNAPACARSTRRSRRSKPSIPDREVHALGALCAALSYLDKGIVLEGRSEGGKDPAPTRSAPAR